jgi:hypothetical protein
MRLTSFEYSQPVSRVSAARLDLVRTREVSIPGELGSSGMNSCPEDVPDLDELDLVCFVSSTPPVGSGCMNYPYLKCCRGKKKEVTLLET